MRNATLIALSMCHAFFSPLTSNKRLSLNIKGCNFQRFGATAFHNLLNLRVHQSSFRDFYGTSITFLENECESYTNKQFTDAMRFVPTVTGCLEIDRCMFDNCKATECDGGAIACSEDGVNMKISNTIFTNCLSDWTEYSCGGAIWALVNYFELTGITGENCRAGFQGNFMYATGSKVTNEKSYINTSSIRRCPGLIDDDGPFYTIDISTNVQLCRDINVSHNHPLFYGAALSIRNSHYIDISWGFFHNNGGKNTFYLEKKPVHQKFTCSYIINNTVSDPGIFLISGKWKIDDVVLWKNSGTIASKGWFSEGLVKFRGCWVDRFYENMYAQFSSCTNTTDVPDLSLCSECEHTAD